MQPSVFNFQNILVPLGSTSSCLLLLFLLPITSLFLSTLHFHTIDPNDLLNPSPGPHFKL
jgi:hypothetical protein